MMSEETKSEQMEWLAGELQEKIDEAINLESELNDLERKVLELQGKNPNKEDCAHFNLMEAEQRQYEAAEYDEDEE
jgi:hypothetical protein